MKLDTVPPVVDLEKTGRKILECRLRAGLTVKDLQKFFMFENPQAIYKWQQGKNLPSVDNLYALSQLLGVRMEDLLATTNSEAEICESPPLPFYGLVSFACNLLFNGIKPMRQ